MGDSFPHHRSGAFKLLGLPEQATKAEIEGAIKKWKCIDLETAAIEKGLVIAALRSFEEWDGTPQAKALPDYPVQITKANTHTSDSPSLRSKYLPKGVKCLTGLRVLEFSRVIAAPVAGRTIAAHSADVLWVTSPTMPSLPLLAIDLSCGKRSIQLNLDDRDDLKKCLALAKEADVLMQSYRPASLADHGLSPDVLWAENPNLIIANLSAYGIEGPWAGRRGFDSLVQTCSGLNVAACGDGAPARVLPCQALDHASGYFLATGILAALYHRLEAESEGGGYQIDVSLAGTGKYLRNLGKHEGSSGFECEDIVSHYEVKYLCERRECAFGEFKGLRHAAGVEGVRVGWNLMPGELGKGEAKWMN